ncbi:MAG: YveK family protein [Clostridia bacterium]
MEELDLKELLNIFWSRRLYILVIVAIFIVIGVIYSYIFVTPKYQSATTIILAKSSTSSTGNNSGDTITTTDLTLNQKLVSTYTELIKSKNILSEVISNLKIQKTEADLKNNITVSAVKDTDLIKITVADVKPEVAQRIASEIADIFIEKVANGVYNINNVQVWDKAEVPTSPYNVNHLKDLVIFAFIGVVIAVIYALIANMLDTSVKNKEDVEKKIGLSVLTSIPLCDFDTSFTKMSKGGKR